MRTSGFMEEEETSIRNNTLRQTNGLYEGSRIVLPWGIPATIVVPSGLKLLAIAMSVSRIHANNLSIAHCRFYDGKYYLGQLTWFWCAACSNSIDTIAISGTEHSPVC
ncbi:hypothetical protein BofuT4_P054380.1 [Botrytis cinerea T4]|uniref:Uncharacterized protein n=1 Tax=Botryotinia fuckeliana (strain T4) TaxID=999810 RepID=G2XVL7_BOTF4|nr:hypothetical protein BofuT4_P054380.1 [Botrytis cinerea T4]